MSWGGRFYRNNSRPAGAAALDVGSAVRSARARAGPRLGHDQDAGIDRGNDRHRVKNGARRNERGGSEVDESLAQGNALCGKSFRALCACSKSGDLWIRADSTRGARIESCGRICSPNDCAPIHGYHRRRRWDHGCGPKRRRPRTQFWSEHSPAF